MWSAWQEELWGQYQRIKELIRPLEHTPRSVLGVGFHENTSHIHQSLQELGTDVLELHREKNDAL